MVSLEGAAQKRYNEIYAANREQLALAVLNELEIPAEQRGQAVEPRPLHIVGHATPWTIDVCTVTTIQPLVHHFGTDFAKTICMDLKVKCHTDLKAKATAIVDISVEVGVVGKWEHYRSLGGRGKRVVTGSAAGNQVTVTLDQNPKAYPYKDEEWQGAATKCVRRHLRAALKHDLTTEEIDQIRLEHFSTEALVPLNNLRTDQSARGIRVHFIVYGMCFEQGPTNGLLPAPRIPLVGEFPNGEVEMDGLTPRMGAVKIRIKCPGLLTSDRLTAEHWYPPSAQEEAMAPEEGEIDSSFSWQNKKTMRRKAMRKAGKQRREDESGQQSDGASSTMSKVARQFGQMPSGRWGDEAGSSKDADADLR